jgi:hypothetical protein
VIRSPEHGTHVPSYDAPSVRLLMPDPCVAERSCERHAPEHAGHLHPHADHGYAVESPDALLARIESCDPHPAMPMRIQIVRFSVNCAVRSREDKRVVDEAIEHRYVARELSLPESCLAGAQGAVRWVRGRKVGHDSR